DRCYYCKNALLSIMQEYYPNAFLCDGTNADDDPARRPGMRALAELGIHSPLRACSISKDEVRQIARTLGLSNADRVCGSCRATALPYDIDIATVFRAD
ncbi:MAG: TIGR00268 family protein, partial [Actinomycetia bacterium]|nr:TIGR00268 family protein [Actinomycetes bacterium]